MKCPKCGSTEIAYLLRQHITIPAKYLHMYGHPTKKIINKKGVVLGNVDWNGLYMELCANCGRILSIHNDGEESECKE